MKPAKKWECCWRYHYSVSVSLVLFKIRHVCWIVYPFILNLCPSIFYNHGYWLNLQNRFWPILPTGVCGHIVVKQPTHVKVTLNNNNLSNKGSDITWILFFFICPCCSIYQLCDQITDKLIYFYMSMLIRTSSANVLFR